MTPGDRFRLALWISLSQLVPLLGVLVCEGVLFREERLADVAGVNRPTSPLLELVRTAVGLMSIMAGPMVGVAIARRRVRGASAVPFMAALPVSAGWALAWAVIPLWPRWASNLLHRTGTPMHDHAFWLTIANWLCFLPVMCTLAWWGASFRGSGAVRDVIVVVGSTILVFMFVRWLSPHAFL